MRVFIISLFCLLLVGCKTITGSERTPLENILYYDCYWGVKYNGDDPSIPQGKTLWVCKKPVPAWDRNFKDCKNATADRIIYKQTCPETGIKSSVGLP